LLWRFCLFDCLFVCCGSRFSLLQSS
jgi:hypothetical protein